MTHPTSMGSNEGLLIYVGYVKQAYNILSNQYVFALIINLLAPFILLLGYEFLEISSVVYLYALHRVIAPEYWLNIVKLNLHSWGHSHNFLSKWKK